MGLLLKGLNGFVATERLHTQGLSRKASKRALKLERVINKVGNMVLEDSKIEKPVKPCVDCGGDEWWQRVPEGHWICGYCYPNHSEAKGKDNK